MGAMQPEDPRDSSRGPGGFWQTLPGILTAAGTFLAGLAGLAAVIVPNFFGKPHAATERVAPVTNASVPETAAAVAQPPPNAVAPTPVSPPAATAPAVRSAPDAPAPDTAEPSQPANDRYIAAFASDGFVVLRSEPTIASAEIRRILVGGAVRCGRAKWSADGYRWRRCVDQEGEAGYMADTFLRKA